MFPCPGLTTDVFGWQPCDKYDEAYLSVRCSPWVGVPEVGVAEWAREILWW